MDNQVLLGSLRAREAELQHLALHDPLTGLANRTLFADRLRHALGRSQRTDAGLGVLLVDLDDFKEVNDVHGSTTGDALLMTVADRLRECVRAEDTVARLGGDEFAILLDRQSEAADDVARRVLAALTAPVQLDGPIVQVSASVGITVTLSSAGDVEKRARDALREADIAMYAAKAAGKNRWRAFGPDLAALSAPQVQDHERLLSVQPPEIWTSRHCDKTLKSATKTLASEEDLGWSMTWNGERSRKGCEVGDETPRPGIYWATAEFDGAEPVRWRMTLTG